MKVILLDNVEKLGNVGSRVVVKPGYARNFLFPKSKAVLDTPKNFKIFEEQQFMLSSRNSEIRSKAKLHAGVINNLQGITIKARSSIQGKLFGSIGARDIARVLTESLGFEVLRSQIRLPNQDLLKSLGVYDIKIHMYSDIYANVTVTVINELSND